MSESESESESELVAFTLGERRYLVAAEALRGFARPSPEDFCLAEALGEPPVLEGRGLLLLDAARPLRVGSDARLERVPSARCQLLSPLCGAPPLLAGVVLGAGPAGAPGLLLDPVALCEALCEATP